MLALSQQVITRQQWTDKKAWQTRNINNTNAGLENSTRPLVFTSTSGCRASGNFDIFSENYFFLIYVNNFFNAGQVPIFRYFEAWNDPQKKHCLGTVSRKYFYWRAKTSFTTPTSALVQMWIKTHRCLLCMKDH